MGQLQEGVRPMGWGFWTLSTCGCAALWRKSRGRETRVQRCQGSGTWEWEREGEGPEEGEGKAGRRPDREQ